MASNYPRGEMSGTSRKHPRTEHRGRVSSRMSTSGDLNTADRLDRWSTELRSAGFLAENGSSPTLAGKLANRGWVARQWAAGGQARRRVVLAAGGWTAAITAAALLWDGAAWVILVLGASLAAIPSMVRGLRRRR